MTLTDEQVLEKLKDRFQGFRAKINIALDPVFTWQHQRATYTINYALGFLHFDAQQAGFYSFWIRNLYDLYEKDNYYSLFNAIIDTVEGKTRLQIKVLENKIKNLEHQVEIGNTSAWEFRLKSQIKTMPTLKLIGEEDYLILEYEHYNIGRFSKLNRSWTRTAASIVIFEDVCTRLCLKGIDVKKF